MKNKGVVVEKSFQKYLMKHIVQPILILAAICL